ncbi:MAG: hypothetical protein JO247_20725 [Chloroflexi bacterium]|nr:hypothetical protein [Chloroflexota bacterium]
MALVVAVRVLAFLAGLSIVVYTLRSAIRTFVLPRGVTDRLSRSVFLSVRGVFDVRTSRAKSYEDRDKAMALYAPVALLLLPVMWLVLVGGGFALIFWAVYLLSWQDSVALSGSSLLTLGFASMDRLSKALLAFSEAIIGLGLLALLIAYLPTIYASWSRREEAVALLEVRAGSPPTAVQMILRFFRIGQIDRLSDLWETWEVWFANIQETHTSLAALAFFRSPSPHRSWITAAGAVLDSAAMMTAIVDVPRDPQRELCLRAGYLALRDIARLFRIEFDPAPRPGDPISVAREEFEEACDRLASAGVPLKPDRDEGWKAFAGWRVNYDTVLLALAALTMAPEAPWISDRSLRSRRK